MFFAGFFGGEDHAVGFEGFVGAGEDAGWIVVGDGIDEAGVVALAGECPLAAVAQQLLRRAVPQAPFLFTSSLDHSLFYGLATIPLAEVPPP